MINLGKQNMKGKYMKGRFPCHVNVHLQYYIYLKHFFDRKLPGRAPIGRSYQKIALYLYLVPTNLRDIACREKSAAR